MAIKNFTLGNKPKEQLCGNCKNFPSCPETNKLRRLMPCTNKNGVVWTQKDK